jgi:hypothetical protein
MTAPSNLETEELELRIEKLRCEVDELKRASNWNRRFGQWVPLFGALLPALALLFAIRQFTVEQTASRQQLVRAAAADSVASERLFMRSILDQQLASYIEAASAAATLSSTSNDADRQKATDTFWKLYWGPLVMFESQEVTERMMAIKGCLNRAPRCSENVLRDSSLALASALKREYLSASRLSPEQYAQRGHDYTTKLQR